MRERTFGFLIGACFLCLLSGLVFIQVFKGDAYRRRSEKNSVRVIPIEAPRGRIFDRNGLELVDNELAFDVAIVYKDVRAIKNIADILSETLDIQKIKILEAVKKAKSNPYTPVIVAEDIGKQNAIALEERMLGTSGVEISTRPKRRYIFGESSSHVLGYIGRISQEELYAFREYGWGMNDFVGRTGVEKQYDTYLKGSNGGMQVEVDSQGRVVNILGISDPVIGKNIGLTIDINLQTFCEDRMEARRGVIIVIDPFTGEVLTLVSRPGFNPNAFAKSGSKEVIRLLNSRDYPLVNRAIGGLYPPGSVFKIVTSASALETRRFPQNGAFSCRGSFRVGNRDFHCWEESGHGTQGITEAIKNSCNVFFYQLGLKAGVDNIYFYGARFGFGQKTGIDLPGEKKGALPSQQWKRRVLRQAWYEGETANYAIGQGYLEVTPLQLARMAASIANGGKLVTPYVVRTIDTLDVSGGVSSDMGISQATLDLIKTGLKRVVNDPDGTGKRAKVPDLIVSGKTGTAQNPKGEAHGWFAGFAPYERPKICVLVFVEHGGRGGVEASMLARDVILKARELRIL